MAEETAHGLLRIVRVGKQLKRTRRHHDRAIGAGEFELLHGLLEQPGVQTKLLCLLSANGQHLRRDVDPININALRQIVKQQTTRATSHIQNRLAIPNNQIAIEEAIRPTGGITTQEVPGSSHHAPIFVAFHYAFTWRSNISNNATISLPLKSSVASPTVNSNIVKPGSNVGASR